MKSVRMRKKAAYLLACTVGCIFVLAGCSSDDSAPIGPVTVSGTVTTSAGAALSDVGVQGVYSSPDQDSNATATTDANGFFSMEVDAGRAFYLHGTIAGYATINSEKRAISVSISDLDIGMPTEAEAQAIVDTAFPSELPRLENHAWLVVDIYDENDNEVNGVAVTYETSVAPADSVYTNCNGTDSGGSLTTGAPCVPDREAPMYIAYFNDTSEISVTVSGITKIAPVRAGEVTFLEYEVAAVVEEPPVEEPPVDEPTAGQLIYDAQCASCHSAGSYDTDGPSGDVIDTGSTLVADTSLGYLAGSMSSIILTQQEVDDLANFLDVEIQP